MGHAVQPWGVCRRQSITQPGGAGTQARAGEVTEGFFQRWHLVWGKSTNHPGESLKPDKVQPAQTWGRQAPPCPQAPGHCHPIAVGPRGPARSWHGRPEVVPCGQGKVVQRVKLENCQVCRGSTPTRDCSSGHQKPDSSTIHPRHRRGSTGGAMATCPPLARTGAPGGGPGMTAAPAVWP